MFELFFFNLFLDWESKTLHHKLLKSVPVAAGWRTAIIWVLIRDI